MKEVFVQHGVYKHRDDSVDSHSHIRDLKVLIITNKTQTYGALRATAFYNFLQHFKVFRLFILFIRFVKSCWIVVLCMQSNHYYNFKY